MVRRIRALGSGFIASLALLLATSVASQECKHPDPQLCAVENAFGGSLVVPQVTEYFDPVGYLHIHYDGLDMGPSQEMAPERLVRPPMISFNVSEPERPESNAPYVLLVVDPDGSSIHTSQSCALMWMITDVYFDKRTNHMSSGFIAAQYSRPNPPEGPLHHRYVFLLYPQPILFLPPLFPSTLIGGRLHFDLPAFTQDYGLGAPIAGNFIKSYWTGVEIPPEELRHQHGQPMRIQAHANPWVAAIIGSVLGLLYGASS